jgi:HEPN domain-containing protein
MSEPDLDEPVRYWLELARGDLDVARFLAAAAGVPSRVAAGLAHQAAEKALQAVIASSGEEPPRSHDLVALAHRVKARLTLTVSEDALRTLTDAHAQSRYPEPEDPSYDTAEVATLVEIATSVLAAAEHACRHRLAEPTVPLFESGTPDLAERTEEDLPGFGER